MQLKTGTPEKRGDDNLIPLINIVFLLLIFFLVAGSIAPGVEKGVEPATLEEGENLSLPPGVVFIAADERLYMDGVETTVEAVLARHAADDSAGGLKLFADHRLPARALIEISHGLREGGAGDITLVTERGVR